MAGANSTVASNVLGTIGTVCLCIQLIPQIWFNWKRKSTEGLPAAMMFLWGSCKQNSPPLENVTGETYTARKRDANSRIK